MGLRLVLDRALNAVHECARLSDRLLDAGWHILGMEDQRLIRIGTVRRGRPFGKAAGEYLGLEGPGSQEDRLVATWLHLDHEVFIGIRDERNVSGRTHLRNE